MTLMIDRRNTKAYKLEKENKKLKKYKDIVDEISKCLNEYFNSNYRVYEENQVEYDYLVGFENLIGQLKGADKE